VTEKIAFALSAASDRGRKRGYLRWEN